MALFISNCYASSKLEIKIKDKDGLKGKVTDMIKASINIRYYWRDVFKDHPISFHLIIMYDNRFKSGMRRRDILNSNMKFIRISSVEINKSFFLLYNT